MYVRIHDLKFVTFYMDAACTGALRSQKVSSPGIGATSDWEPLKFVALNSPAHILLLRLCKISMK